MSLCLLLLLCFLCRSSPQKLFSKLADLKFRKVPLKNPRWISVFVAAYWPSYLLNCVACCPWIFVAVISRNIFDWLLQSKAANGGVLLKKVVLESFVIFTGKHLCRSPQAYSFIKKMLQHKWFPVNITKNVRTPILITSENGCFV